MTATNWEGSAAAPAGPDVARDGIVRQIEAEIPRLRRFARAMASDRSLADDLVQECLERALGRLHLWQPGTNLRAWLFTILRNLHINSVRRRQVFVDIDQEAFGSIGSHGGGQVVRLELRDLRRALARLPLEQREVVLLIGLEGCSYAEAAAILEVSIGTVKSRLSRGRRALRMLMDGQKGSTRTDDGRPDWNGPDWNGPDWNGPGGDDQNGDDQNGDESVGDGALRGSGPAAPGQVGRIGNASVAALLPSRRR